MGAATTEADGTITIGAGGKPASYRLNYTGSGETTDRVVSILFNAGSSQTISASGTGLFKFTSGAAITLAANNPFTLGASPTFTGTNDLNLGTGAVTIRGVNRTITATNSAATLTLGGGITENGVRSLTEAGDGTLALNGAAGKRRFPQEPFLSDPPEPSLQATRSRSPPGRRSMSRVSAGGRLPMVRNSQVPGPFKETLRWMAPTPSTARKP